MPSEGSHLGVRHFDSIDARFSGAMNQCVADASRAEANAASEGPRGFDFQNSHVAIAVVAVAAGLAIVAGLLGRGARKGS